MITDFIPNPDFLVSPAARAAVEPLGQEVIDLAEKLAPYRLGYLEKSISGEWVEEGGKQVFRVTATDFKGDWQEFGTENQAAQPFLGPAAMQIVGNLH
jgi:HK97 gp10 family phage protein